MHFEDLRLSSQVVDPFQAARTDMLIAWANECYTWKVGVFSSAMCDATDLTGILEGSI